MTYNLNHISQNFLLKLKIFSTFTQTTKVNWKNIINPCVRLMLSYKKNLYKVLKLESIYKSFFFNLQRSLLTFLKDL